MCVPSLVHLPYVRFLRSSTSLSREIRYIERLIIKAPLGRPTTIYYAPPADSRIRHLASRLNSLYFTQVPEREEKLLFFFPPLSLFFLHERIKMNI